MLSLAGLPPFAGFVGKFYIFRSLISEGFVELAVLGIIGSVISAYYYLRIVKIMYLDETEEQIIFGYNFSSKLILGISSILVISFLLYAKSVVSFIEYISYSVS